MSPWRGTRTDLLLDAAGEQEGTKAPRPAKMVRNIAGLVSIAFARAVKWRLITNNPVSHSEPPVPKKRRGIDADNAEDFKQGAKIDKASAS